MGGFDKVWVFNSIFCVYHSLLSYVLDKLDANDDSLDYKTMKETLEYSGMDLIKMREQVEGCHSQEDKT